MGVRNGGLERLLRKLGEMGFLCWGMFCRVMPSPSSRTDADELMECARERRLVVESRSNRDLGQRYARLAHQLFRVVNAMLR